uniref:Si:dkey-40c11.2 n=2 Tax=Seriola lalandi dorsalis TaxID=1841481 RepID=A0A3B4Y1V2_SERLL
MKERRDAEERDRKMNEKLQMIEEQRRKQAEQEEELRRKEKVKWEQQQREHEDDMRARLRRSESIEKAAEAAALVSQRSMNPREFFRQLSSSSSQSPTSPGSSRTGKPFRRYQRSLTDTAFIFSKAEESRASSPRSSPLVSPFSRLPPSPIYRAMSPPTSPDFRPVTSPQRPRAPISPPTSPLHPAPPISALPSVPPTNSQAQAVDEPKPPSPTEPSAPPASPSLLAFLSPSLVQNNSSQSHPEAPPPNTPTQPEHSAFCFEPGLPLQAPTAPLPERPQPNTDLNTATHVHTELVSDISYKVQAVLVEEDEEEDVEEHEEDKGVTQPESCAVTTEPVQTEAEEQEQEEEGEEKQEEEKEEEEEGLKQEAEPASQEEPVEVVQEEDESKTDGEENDQSEDSQGAAEPAEPSEKEEESAVIDAEPVFQEIKHEAVIPSTNGITNGEDTQEQNGIERSLSPSDTELSSPELAVCYDFQEEDDVTEDKEQEISENGQEVLAERQMCVRALYDYQAEDESEISFEPGDIIRDVETVDKAWWRGWSKDGRQGLFPANYVETI